MSQIILLDSSPLGLVTNPKRGGQADACRVWLQDRLADGNRVLVPEITDYEIRRELLRAGKTAGLRALDALKTALGFVPLTTGAMLQAAAFWAQARQTRLPTADNLALDVDMILAAQAVTLNPYEWGLPGATVVIATSNVGHLARVVTAQEWQTIY